MSEVHPQKINLDYTQVGSTYETLYIGLALQAVLNSESRWLIKKLSYVTVGGSNRVSQMQVLNGVSWDDRASLPWT